MYNTSTFDMKYLIHVTKDGDFQYLNCETFSKAVENIVDFDVDMEDELASILLDNAKEADGRLCEGASIQNCCDFVNLALTSLSGMWEVEYSTEYKSYEDDCEYENELF